MATRRDFLRTSGLLALGSMAAGLLAGNENNHLIPVFGDDQKDIQLPKLEYGYDALEPFIDKRTMEIHHTKHHQAYIDKLNKAPKDSFDRNADAATNCRKIGKSTDALIRNNMGGHYNHELFWQLLRPASKASRPGPELLKAINNEFQSLENFQTAFADNAVKIFGSGWCWLVVDKAGKLKISTTANQDNPLMSLGSQGSANNEEGSPLLGLDVWEHAYYLQYQNKRAEYVKAWWNVLNWDRAEVLLGAARK